MFRPISGYPQVHNLSLQHDEDTTPHFQLDRLLETVADNTCQFWDGTLYHLPLEICALLGCYATHIGSYRRFGTHRSARNVGTELPLYAA
jgi:hypothetical protein